MRSAAVAAALAGALALTACSGGGDSGGDTSSDRGGSATPTASAGAPSGSSGTSGDTGGTGGTGGTAATSGPLQGSWLATTGGKAVALVINGTRAGLFSTGGSVCSGAAEEESGMRMIRLTCTDGSKDRTTGMVDSVDGKSMKVTWSGALGAETFTKAEGGKFPTGLPTAALGS
ncbi:hypothetical protein AB0F77_21040 [Streptomyces sp. NPDC026672]|uniref:hypothetical protein n=1 Tax=unclassified Streptomyces TaxID=2593676 RepID=UPI0033F61788